MSREVKSGLTLNADANFSSSSAVNAARTSTIAGKSHVRLVAAIEPHGIVVTHARERRLDLVSRGFERGRQKPSTTSQTRSGWGYDISRSIWVNSGCRSARRSSSRKQRTIWKYLSNPEIIRICLNSCGDCGKRVKAPGLHPAGNEIIARAFRS